MIEAIGKVGVVGLGVMGFDIAFLYAMKGFHTSVYNASKTVMESLTNRREQTLERLKRRNRIRWGPDDSYFGAHARDFTRRRGLRQSEIRHDSFFQSGPPYPDGRGRERRYGRRQLRRGSFVLKKLGPRSHRDQGHFRLR